MKKKFLFLFILFIILIFVLYNNIFKKSNLKNCSYSIEDYDRSIDREDLIRILNDNFYWMVDGIDQKEYDFGKKLDSGVVNEVGENANKKEFVKVIRIDKKAVAFVTYYEYSENIGRIHLLCVDKNYRRCGFAEILSKYVIEYFFNKNFKNIFLSTRIDNIRAQSLYKKLGFVENNELSDGSSTIFVLYKDMYFNK